MSIGSNSAVPTYVVSASYDKQVRLWDAATGRTVRTFTFQDSQVNQLQIMPVTLHLAVTGFGVIRLYDTSSLLGSGADGAPTSGAGGGGGGNSAASSTAAPPLIASFESQSTMNFTSVGGIPLQPVKRREDEEEEHGADANAGGNLNDSTSGLGATCVLNDFGLVTIPTHYGADDPRGPYAPGLAIYATSEDGHVRFFDGRSLGTLNMVKDIATGASITCSAITPDRRFLLTGSQMGIVCVWHLPSIIASASEEGRRRAGRATSTAKPAPVPPPAAAAATTDAAATDSSKPQESHADPQVGTASTTEAATAESGQQPRTDATPVVTVPAKPKNLSYKPQPGLFTSHPLQEIAFEKDYSAIRSITCDPTGHWIVVATNAGKLHFLRFAQDAKMGGSRTRSSVETTSGSRSGSGADAQRVSAERGSGGGVGLDNDDRRSSAPSVSSRLDFGGSAASGKSSADAVAAARGRESIYRSALVVNELSSNARRQSSSGGSSPAGKDSAFAAPAAMLQHGGSALDSHSGGNTMGAVLLNSLEQQRGNSSVAAAVAAANLTGDGAGGANMTGVNVGSPLSPAGETRDPLQDESLLEPFHTVQAHYKYILRVAISPDGHLIVTCSADYTIGRYSVPTFMRPEALCRHVVTDAAAAEAEVAAAAPQKLQSADASSVLDVHTANVSITSTQAPGQDGRMTCPTSGVSTPAPQDPSGEPSDLQERDDAAAAAAASAAAARDASPAATAEDAPAAAPLPNASLHSTVDANGGTNGEQTGTHSFSDAGAVLADMSQLTQMKPLMGHNRWVWDCAFSECGEYLFSASSDNHVRMWNGLATDRPQSTTFVGHTKPVVSVILYAEPQIAPRV